MYRGSEGFTKDEADAMHLGGAPSGGFGELQVVVVIGVLFRLFWLEIDGFHWFRLVYPIGQGHLFSKKDTYGCGGQNRFGIQLFG